MLSRSQKHVILDIYYIKWATSYSTYSSLEEEKFDAKSKEKVVVMEKLNNYLSIYTRGGAGNSEEAVKKWKC